MGKINSSSFYSGQHDVLLEENLPPTEMKVTSVQRWKETTRNEQ